MKPLPFTVTLCAGDPAVRLLGSIAAMIGVGLALDWLGGGCVGCVVETVLAPPQPARTGKKPKDRTVNK